jgi:hypothetical protein
MKAHTFLKKCFYRISLSFWVFGQDNDNTVGLKAV